MASFNQERLPNVDLPLNPIDLHILLAIASTPLDSYRILQFVSAQSTLEIGLQTVYTHLKSLRKRHWVERTTQVDDGTPQREMYQLSRFGIQVVQAEIQRLEDLVKYAHVVGLMPSK